MTIEKVEIGDIKRNPSNPRTIKDDKFRKLVKSIKDFPEMLQIRPIVVDDNMVVLGGNMRLKACIEAGLSEVFIIKASTLTEDQKLEHIYFLAWGAMKDAGKVVKPFGDAFLDTLDSVELDSDPNSESTETA